jgi:cytochrome c-type biogenesis protein CcmE
MKPGVIVAIILSIVGFTAVLGSFLANASPYVTVAQARTMNGDNLHLSGDIVPGTLQVSGATTTVTFAVKDMNGDVAQVVYKGPPPANMGAATKVVAIGSMTDAGFVARKLLLKCPSKYESEPKGAGA